MYVLVNNVAVFSTDPLSGLRNGFGSHMWDIRAKTLTPQVMSVSVTTNDYLSYGL